MYLGLAGVLPVTAGARKSVATGNPEPPGFDRMASVMVKVQVPLAFVIVPAVNGIAALIAAASQVKTSPALNPWAVPVV